MTEIAKSDRVSWKPAVVAEGAKGPIIAEVACIRVYLSRDGWPIADQHWLFFRKNNDGEIKYAISNAPKEISLSELVEASRRFSTIIVETDRAGYSSNPYRGKLSLRTSETGDVIFKNVRVPGSNLIGEEGQGFYNIMNFFNRSRVQVAALGVGTAQGALDKAIAHVRQREQFGRPLASQQMVQGKIAEMATLTEAARSICYRAAARIDSGQPDPTLSSMAKWYTAEVAVKVADEAIQLHGGYGILEEYDVAHYWRNAKVLEIFEGSKEVEKVIIARKILGKF